MRRALAGAALATGRSGPGDRGEAVWGFYLALLGVIVMLASPLSSFTLWLCTGSC